MLTPSPFGLAPSARLSPEVDFLLFKARHPGVKGLEAALTAYGHVPSWQRPEMFRRLWRYGPDRLTWAVLLCDYWRYTCMGLMAAAGGRAGLVAWWRHADYGQALPPYLEALCGAPAGMPDELVLYRGGIGPADALVERGLSWSLYPNIAAYYALCARKREPDGGTPLVLRCTVPREAVLWRWLDGDGEVLVAEPCHVVEVAGDLEAMSAGAMDMALAGLEVARRKHDELMRDPRAALSGEVLPQP